MEDRHSVRGPFPSKHHGFDCSGLCYSFSTRSVKNKKGLGGRKEGALEDKQEAGNVRGAQTALAKKALTPSWGHKLTNSNRKA
jgi:hypothetical protein